MSTRITYLFALMFAVSSAGMFAEADAEPTEGGRPNILFVITDDQSFPYASAYGVSGVKTPGFDENWHQVFVFVVWVLECMRRRFQKIYLMLKAGMP